MTGTPQNLVSVVVPCYNAERYLCDTLDSVLAQTYRPLEIILVDDGSTDRTVEIARSRDASIIVVRHEQNRGLNHARNTGVQHAQGAYIQFLDSDDLIAPEKIERQAAVLDGNPACDVVFSEVREFSERPEEARQEGWREHKERQDYLGAFLVTNAMAIHAPLIRRSCIELARGFATDLSGGGEDWDFWIRICLLEARFTFLPGVLALYRKHAASMCGNGFGYYEWERVVLPRAVEHLRARGVKEPVRWHALALGLCRLAVLAQRNGKREEACRLCRQAGDIRPPVDADWEQHSLSEHGARMSTAYLGFSLAMLEADGWELAADLRKLANAYLAVAETPASLAEQAVRRRILRAEPRFCRQRARVWRENIEGMADLCVGTGAGEEAGEITLEFARLLDELGRLECHPDTLRAATQVSERAAIHSLRHGEPNRVSSGREWLLLRGRQALLNVGFRRLSRALALLRRSVRSS